MDIFTTIDLETTGLDHNHDRIIEVSAIRMAMPEGKRLSTFQSLIKQDVMLDEFITNLTGIKSAQLQDPLTTIDETNGLRTLKMLCENATVVAQHAPFDLAFLYPHIIPKHFVCTRTLSKMVEPNESASLAPTCERLGINHQNAHSALGDAEATWEVFKKRREQLGEEADIYNKVMNSKERPLQFIPRNAEVITKL